VTDLLQNLTDSQRDAVTTIDGPLLIVAGPGSGKTRVVTTRVAYLITQGIPPWNILCLTFTNKAAEEMKNRVESLVNQNGAWVSTFHSFASRSLRRDINLESYTSDFTIYDRADQITCLKGVLRGLKLDAVEYGLNRLPGRIGRAKNRMETPERFQSSDATFAKIYAAYLKALQDANALDFDDLLWLFLRMLKEKPEILARYTERFTHILVDEYQDTNRLQYEIVRLLAADRGNLCVTGDPDQSIYRWRGADIRNILDFRREYPSAPVIYLEENFRSVESILEAAGRLIACNEKREPKKLIPVRDQGRSPLVFQAFDPEDEAIRVADEIAQIIHGGIEPREIAIFYRTNAQSRVLESALLDQNIPYVIVGSVEFYRRKEIKDFIAYLRLAVNPRDDVAFLRIHNLPPRGIGAQGLARIRAKAVGLSLSEAAEALAQDAATPPRLQKALQEFSGILCAIRDFAREDMAGLFRHTIRLTSYKSYIEKTSPDKADDRLENIAELETACQEWDEKHPSGGLTSFLEEVSLLSDVDRWDRRESVSLMTLHAAKGLEFNAVVMVGMEEGLLPHFGATAEEDTDRIEEERRLCFVGMTRARDRLLLTWAKNRRTVQGDVRFGRPSRFLTEAELVHGLAQRSDSRILAGKGPPAARRPRKGPALGTQPFRTGDLVRHQAFGQGRVLALQGMGESAKVVIEFPGRGLKTFAVNLAPIFRVNP